LNRRLGLWAGSGAPTPYPLHAERQIRFNWRGLRLRAGFAPDDPPQWALCDHRQEHPLLPYLIDLSVVSDPRGNLCFIEGGRHVSFPIARVYYLYDVPSGSTRAGHAHRALQQLLIAVSGSFDVRLNDGRRETIVTLNRPNRGLLIGPGVWREIDNFSSGAVCLVLASAPYDESDYFRDFDAFLAHVSAQRAT
jgi:dTDP-4-dehydrorhamnose 3,5-epimerase-like enzyme